MLMNNSPLLGPYERIRTKKAIIHVNTNNFYHTKKTKKSILFYALTLNVSCLFYCLRRLRFESPDTVSCFVFPAV